MSPRGREIAKQGWARAWCLLGQRLHRAQPARHDVPCSAAANLLLLLSRLLDEWASVDKRRPILIPSAECGRLPRDYCPVPVELYGLRRTPDGGCTLDRWLVPAGCLLPPPYPVLLPLLGRWERQSQKLAVGGEARRAFQEFLPYFEAEMGRVGDASLGQEVDILERLIAA